MKRIIILLFVTLSLAAISAPTDSVQKTVTLTQEQLDQLLQDAAEADQYKYIVQEATDQLRSEMESRYNTYVTHVGNNMTLYTGALGLFGVYLTMLIALAGILVPVLINRRFEKSIEKKIDNHDKKIEETQNTANTITQQFQETANKVNESLTEIQNKIEDHENKIKDTQDKFDEAQKAAQESAEQADKAKESAGRSAQAAPYFYQALNEKDLDKKIELNTEAIKQNPYFAEAYNNRGVAYRKKGDIPQAIKDYNKAIELNPNYAEAFYNLGNAYYHKEEFNDAIKDYTKAIELNSNYATAYYNRASCYIKLAKKETDNGKAKEYYQKALDDCNTGLSRNPDKKVRKALETIKRLCEERLNDLQA